jgi:hypothetical protein
MKIELKKFALQHVQSGEVVEVVALDARDALYKQVGMVALIRCNGFWTSGGWQIEAPTERFYA